MRIFTVFFLSLIVVPCSTGQTSKVVGKVTTKVAGTLAKETCDQIAKELLQEGSAGLAKRLPEQSVASLRTQLSRTIGEHGEEVVTLARRIPEAIPALANRASVLLPLAKNMGDDILRIEARAPGLAEAASNVYGKSNLPRLLALPDEQMRQVLALSTHAVDSQAASMLLRATEKGGSAFLKQLSPSVIVASGLSVALIRAAGGATDIAEGIKDSMKASPEMFLKEASKSVTTLGHPIALSISAVILAWGGVMVWRRYCARS